MMNYNVKGTGISITPELRNYLEKKLEHAGKFMRQDSTAHADVELEFAEGERAQKYRAEIMVTMSGDVYRVEEKGNSMHEAIDIAVQELGRELAREKKKKIHILRRGAGKAKDFLRGFRRKV